MTDNQHHWKARNKKTGEVCSHKHHSQEHAMRCAIAIYGEDYASVRKWVTEAPTHARIQKNNRKRAIAIHNEMYNDTLVKENEKRKRRVMDTTNKKRKKSVRGVVRFDEKD